jgi:hypothetical protein
VHLLDSLANLTAGSSLLVVQSLIETALGALLEDPKSSYLNQGHPSRITSSGPQTILESFLNSTLPRVS